MIKCLEILDIKIGKAKKLTAYVCIFKYTSFELKLINSGHCLPYVKLNPKLSAD